MVRFSCVYSRFVPLLIMPRPMSNLIHMATNPVCTATAFPSQQSMVRSGEGNSHHSARAGALGGIGGFNRKHSTRKIWHCAPRRPRCSRSAAIARGPGFPGSSVAAVRQCQQLLGPTASISRHWHVPERCVLPLLFASGP